MTTRTIVAISGGLNKPSSTRLLTDRLVEAAVSELKARGVQAQVEVVELRDHAHDTVNAMLSGFPSGDLKGVLERLAAADGVIAVSPIYTTGASGLFKSFVDIIEKEALTGMPVLLGATGGTARHSLALEYAIRPMFTYLRTDVVTTAVFVATDDWSGQADDVNPLPARISRAGRELAELVAARDETPGRPVRRRPLLRGDVLQTLSNAQPRSVPAAGALSHREW
ncbi:CE1759 family FMN reductase [Sanguibacter sp. Z1732]|uniref:CE1759 family FMN reductase n=1 Tax=Sanguibacter sp. Z1732 TaxID=3435412 RepID=UPI003D9C8608